MNTYIPNEELIRATQPSNLSGDFPDMFHDMFHKRVVLEISASGGNAEKTIQFPGGSTFLMTNLGIRLYDKRKVYDIVGSRDMVTLEMFSVDHNVELQDTDPLDLYQFSELFKREHYRPLVIQGKEQVRVRATHDTFITSDGSASHFTFPIRVELAFSGYKA